jgi:hypothetical protein
MATNLDFNHYIVPPGGYHFPVAAGITVIGSSWDDLIDRVRQWRIDNGKNIGHPREEILAYFEKTWPSSIRYLSTPVLTSEDGAEPTGSQDDPFSRTMRWLNRLRDRLPMGGGEIAHDDDIEKRKAACEKCPKHKPLTVPCTKCSGSLNTAIAAVTKGKVTDTSGGYCKVLGAPCGVLQVLQPSNLGLSASSKAAVWGGCWLYEQKKD